MATDHVHRCDTNGNRYRCPVPGCWWQPTGVQALPGPHNPATCRDGDHYGQCSGVTP